MEHISSNLPEVSIGQFWFVEELKKRSLETLFMLLDVIQCQKKEVQEQIASIMRKALNYGKQEEDIISLKLLTDSLLRFIIISKNLEYAINFLKTQEKLDECK